MYIKVESLISLCEKYPELQTVRDITANHGTESEISLLCELISKLYDRLDNEGAISPAKAATVKATKNDK